METFIALLLLIVVGATWFSAMRTRQYAIDQCRRACRALGVQLLDDTVALQRLALKRDRRGRLRLLKVYAFEYSLDGTARWQGRLKMRGTSMESLRLDREHLPAGSDDAPDHTVR